MAIEFCCPFCSSILEADSEKAGKKSPCPGCSILLRIPFRFDEEGDADWHGHKVTAKQLRYLRDLGITATPRNKGQASFWISDIVEPIELLIVHAFVYAFRVWECGLGDIRHAAMVGVKRSALYHRILLGDDPPTKEELQRVLIASIGSIAFARIQCDPFDWENAQAFVETFVKGFAKCARMRFHRDEAFVELVTCRAWELDFGKELAEQYSGMNSCYEDDDRFRVMDDMPVTEKLADVLLQCGLKERLTPR